MNRLAHAQRVSVVKALCEGVSVRGTVRLTGVSKQSILTLLLKLGAACLRHEDAALRGLRCDRIEADEVWSFIGCKQRNAPTTKLKGAVGDNWTWYAIDADTKLIVSWIMGSRDEGHAFAFMHDLASRLAMKPQLTTDGLGAYAAAVQDAFWSLGVDYAQVSKIYGKSEDERRYSPPQCIGCEKRAILGDPDKRRASTSYIERANLSLRTSQRRWTRLSLGHSKSFTHAEAAFALHACHFNWVRRHATIKTTPAVAAGLADREWTVDGLVALLEAEEAAEIASGKLKRGKYRPRRRDSI